MRVQVYEYNIGDKFGSRFAVRTMRSMSPSEAWEIWTAPNNWKSREDAEKWCEERGYDVV